MENEKFEYLIDNKSIILNIGKDEFNIDYQKNILKEFGKENAERIAENIIYLFTVPFGMIQNNLDYKNRPFFEKLIQQGVIKDIPRIAEESGDDTSKLISTFNKVNLSFIDNNARKLSIKKDNNPEDVIIGMSFGKDSLLSFGLAEEIGLDMNLVFFNDTEEIEAHEYKHKMALAREFSSKSKKEINIVRDNTDNIFTKKGKLIEEFIKTNAMLSYALEILPLSHKYGSKYTVLGNEQNFNDVFINKDGFKAYPSYDQTSEYMAGMNNLLARFGGEFQILSLIEPIYNIAEYKILNNRYPGLLRYIMSCSGDENERWCYNCPMCAKTYLYSQAVGIEPKKIGFKENFFDKKFEKFYPLFSKPTRAYEKPAAVRDEQLLAFYLAYKNDCKGYLIEKFKKKFIEEAKERQDELFKKFFAVHDGKSMPMNLKNKVKPIFKEELSK